MKNKKLLSGVLLGALILGLQALLFAESNITIYNYEGRATVIHNKKTIMAEIDVLLQDTDTLRVEPNTFVDINAPAIFGVRFFESSECVFANTNASNTHLKLNSGSALINVRGLPSGGRFSIETPAFIATTSEGQFWISSKKEGDQLKSTLAMKKGRMSVTIKSSSSTLAVIDGQAVDVSSKSFIPTARAINDEEMAIIEKINTVYIPDAN